jgi:ubiquitin C-terminal hydrolase
MGCIIPKSPKHESCITPTPTIPLSETTSEGQYSKSSYKFVHKEVTENILNKNSLQGIIGLKNLGNTCYMNSALQCLSNTVPLVDYFLGYCWTNELNPKNPVGTGGIVAEQFGYLISKMWNQKTINNLSRRGSSSSSLSPLDFKKAISSFRSQFRGNSQHDSHEFLAFLLDGLHEDLNRVLSKPLVDEIDSDGKTQEDVAVEAWKAYLLRNRSIIVDIFQGQLRNILSCLFCHYQSYTFDPFMYMTVPIGVRIGRISLYDCLAEFCKPEILSLDCQVSDFERERERGFEIPFIALMSLLVELSKM